jgi:hypothetical protein
LLPSPTPAPIPENASPAVWHLDGEQPPPGPAATSFSALVTERNCSSGRDIRNLLLPPVIAYSELEVVVSLYLEPTDGGTCIGVGPTPFTIELAGPLGDRELVDGIGGTDDDDEP